MSLIETKVTIDTSGLDTILLQMPDTVRTSALIGAQKGAELVKRGIDAGRPTWAPLADMTIRIKGHDKILYDKGDMYNSVGAENIGPNEAVYFTDTWYAAIHEFGLLENATPSVPRRQFFMPTVQGTELKEIVDAVTTYITNQINK